MGSSVELDERLKMKFVDAHKAGKGYKKISKRFGISVSTIRSIIQKWKLTGTVKVKPRSGRPRKISDKTARLLGRKALQNPHMTAKELQKGLADTGLVVHPSTVQRCLNKQGLYRQAIKVPEETPSDESTPEVCKAASE